RLASAREPNTVRITLSGIGSAITSTIAALASRAERRNSSTAARLSASASSAAATRARSSPASSPSAKAISSSSGSRGIAGLRLACNGSARRFDGASELLAGTGEPTHDRSDRDLQDVSRLLVGQAVHGDEDQDLALLLGQQRDLAANDGECGTR